MTATPEWYNAMFFRLPRRGEKNGNQNPGMIAVLRLSYHKRDCLAIEQRMGYGFLDAQHLSDHLKVLGHRKLIGSLIHVSVGSENVIA